MSHLGIVNDKVRNKTSVNVKPSRNTIRVLRQEIIDNRELVSFYEISILV